MCLTGGNQNRLVLTGNINCAGIIDFSSNVGIVVEIRGTSNIIDNYVCGSNDKIQFNSTQSCSIPAVTYNNLQISNTGVKYITADLTTSTLTIDGGATLELGSYNSTIITSQLSGLLTKASSTGTVNFTGIITIYNSTGALNFLSSPTVNILGNIALSGSDMRSGFNLGSGTINVLTTQSWTVNTGGNIPVAVVTNGTILIASGRTLTILGPGNNLGGLLINGTSTINGVDGTSVLNISGCYSFGNTNLPMTTGVFNPNSSGTSQIRVEAGVTMTLPLTSFYDLTINGALVTLSGDTTVSHNLNVSTGTLQMASYDLSVSGNTSYGGTLAKSGTGSVSFNTLSAQASTGAISFTGNPTINLSGNVSGDVRSGFNFGTTPINILANLNIGVWAGGNVAVVTNASFIIGSGKTLTNTGQSTTLGGISTTGTITGVDGTSIFNNQSNLYYLNSTDLMSTGVLQCNATTNTVNYTLAGEQNIIAVTYRNLTLGGSSSKTLLGNVSVINTYTLTSPATLNSNGFSLTNP